MDKKRHFARTLLAVGGTDRDKIKKAAASQADMVFCDLEDAVAPSEKATARLIVGEALRTHHWENKTRAVRINALNSPYWQDDIIGVLKESKGAIDCLLVPKVENAKEVRKVEKMLRRYERKFSLPHPVSLACLIETPEGIEKALTIAQKCPRVETLIFGGADFAATMGAKPDLPHQGDIFAYPRYRLVAAARAANLHLIDTPFVNFRDEEGLHKATLHAAAWGFGGKMVIHPAQIEVVNKIFTPSQEEIAHAQKVLAAYQAALDAGEGVIAIEGEMIDVATARLYQNLIEKAEQLGL